ncbi:MAG TPA: HemK/PrmC family methyltransferase [Candidatus Limnocylindria bacterium]
MSTPAVNALPPQPRVRDLIPATTDALRESSPSPRLDAELLIAHAFGRDRSWLHSHADEALGQGEIALLFGWLQRRRAGEPIAYIRGYKDWLSLRILTDPRALIPRPETELLAETAVEEIAARLVRDDAPIAAWEVATGSGAVSVALGLRFRQALALGRLRLGASDISAEALELASENLAAHGLSGLVTLGCGDLMDPPVLPAPQQPDVLLANLPYLTSDEVASGAGSLAHEPALALDGGADGLDKVRRLVALLPDRLAVGGVALLEIGHGQAEAVRRLVADLSMEADVSVLQDLAGIERVVRIQRA